MKKKITQHSLSNKLKKDNKTTEEFELMLSSLTLEEIIGLKLELSSKLFGANLYGLPIFHSVKELVNDALLKYAISASRTKREAAAMLGLAPKDFRTYVKKYKTLSFFEDNC